MRTAAIILVLLLIIPFAAPRELSRGSVEVLPVGQTIQEPVERQSAATERQTIQEPVERQTIQAPVGQSAASTERQAPSIPSVPGAELTQAHYAELLKAEMASYIRVLTCPEPTKQAVTLPKMPVPEGSDDCALIGKSAEIEAYLKSLEAAAAKCNARREASYKNALAAKQKLDNQIDQLWPSPPNLPKSFKMAPICSESEPSVIGTSPSEMVPDEQDYTSWLKRVGGDVKEYCGIIDTQFISGIANACKSMNKEIPCIMDYYKGVKDTDKVAFHARLNGQLNALNILYTYTDFFYKKTIVEYGIGNFRKYYNESNLDCGTLTPAQISIAKKQIEIASLKNALPVQGVQQPLQRDNVVVEELPSWEPTGAITFTRMWGSPMYVKKTANSSQGFAWPCQTYVEGNKTRYSCITRKLSRGSTFPIGTGGLGVSDMAVGRMQECVRGTSRCTNSTFERCVGGFWVSTEQCGKSETCTTGGCRIVSGYYSARQRAMATRGYTYNANVQMTGGFA